MNMVGAASREVVVDGCAVVIGARCIGDEGTNASPAEMSAAANASVERRTMLKEAFLFSSVLRLCSLMQ